MQVPDVLAALERSRSWLYTRMAEDGPDRIPHRKFEGSVVFTAGELRAWIREREEVIHGGRMDAGFKIENGGAA